MIVTTTNVGDIFDRLNGFRTLSAMIYRKDALPTKLAKFSQNTALIPIFFSNETSFKTKFY